MKPCNGCGKCCAPQLRIQIVAAVPGSNFNRQGGSEFNRYEQIKPQNQVQDTLQCAENLTAFWSLNSSCERKWVGWPGFM